MIVSTEVGNPGTLSSYYESQTRDKFSTPKPLRDRGILLDLPYSKSQTAIKQTITKVLRAGLYPAMGWDNQSCRNMGIGVQRLDTPSFPNEADVISKLASKWKNTDLNIGMYLSPEGRESVEMMASSMLKIANSARDLKRGNFGAAVRHLNHMPRSHVKKAHRRFEQGDISGSFLAMHLGWSPLISDVFEASDMEPPVETGIQIKATKLGAKPRYSLAWPASAGRAKPVTYNGVDIRRTTYIGNVRRPPTFSERFGLGNPFSVAWELVPLSFVADYFVPIGSTIDSMYFISQCRFDGLWRKQYSESKTIVGVPVGGMLVWDMWGQACWNTTEMNLYHHERSFTRKPHVMSFADPLRTINVKLPTSLMRLGTIAALTHQRLLHLK